MNTRESAECGLFLHDAELQEIVEIAEAPGDEAKTRDAEKSVKNLGIYFDPDAARGLEVAAVFLSVGAGWVAHEFVAAADQQEEEHAAPSDDVESVEDDEEAERCDCEFPECFEADDGGFTPSVFGREFVAVGVYAVGIWAYVLFGLFCGGDYFAFFNWYWNCFAAWILEFLGERSTLWLCLIRGVYVLVVLVVWYSVRISTPALCSYCDRICFFLGGIRLSIKACSPNEL